MKESVARIVDGQIELDTDYYYKDYIKTIPGRRWDPMKKCWVLPDTEQSREMLQAIRGLQGMELPEATPAAEEPREAAVPTAPMPIKVKPFEHQVAGFNLGISKPNAALLFEMGCGKSLTAVAIAGRRFLDGQIRRLLIVAPLSVLPVWPREFKDYADFPHRVRVLEGSSDKKKEYLQKLTQWGESACPRHLEVVLVNYESAWRILDALSAWKPDMIICDESQRIKTHNSNQSKGLHKLGRVAKYKLILTGTPVTNSPLDFWSQYQFLQPGLFQHSFYAFRNTYACMGGYSGKEVILYKNLADLTATAHSIACRVTKAEALDLPDTVDQLQYCTLEPEAQRIYNDLARTKVAELEVNKKVTTAEIIVQLLRLSQITGGYLRADDDETVRQVSWAKIKLLRETVADILDSGQKVVIFARFRAEIADLIKTATELAGDDGYRAIWGDVPAADRGQAVKDFQADSKVKVFVAQIATAGLGITLTAASTAIFYSLDYSYANYEQAKARIHRIGQQQKCNYIHLIAKGTIDERVMAALENKRSMADDVVDNWQTAFSKVKKEDDQ